MQEVNLSLNVIFAILILFSTWLTNIDSDAFSLKWFMFSLPRGYCVWLIPVISTESAKSAVPRLTKPQNVSGSLQDCPVEMWYKHIMETLKRRQWILQHTRCFVLCWFVTGGDIVSRPTIKILISESLIHYFFCLKLFQSHNVMVRNSRSDFFNFKCLKVYICRSKIQAK